MIKELSRKLGFSYRNNGALVLCFSKEDMPKLEELYQRGLNNGVEALEIIDGEKAREMEPNLSKEVYAALYCPTSAIVCPFELTQALCENACRNGLKYRFSCRAEKIEKKDGYYLINDEIKTRSIINCAGVYADEIHNQVCDLKYHIVPKKGDYVLLDKNMGAYVNMTLFTLPTEKGKGVLVTPTVHGNLLVGPTAEDIPDKQDVDTTAEGLAKVLNLGSNSVDALDGRQTITSFAGLRAHLVHEDPAEKSDFLIEEAAGHPGFIDVAGIESPGLTSAPAIGEYVAQIVENIYPAERKADFVDTRKGIPSMALATEEEREALIRENPAFANVICRCELVTEGEILSAIHRLVGATTLDGVKRRTRAGMGRCQAGFCSPKTLEILSRELHLDPAQITKEGTGSEILVGKNKDTAPGEGGTWKRTQEPGGKEALHE